MESRPGRVMILGLDGATLDLIRPWAEAGILPTFQKLIREGAWGPLQSTMPPLTPVAWSSFMTGKNPGKHGVFDFTSQNEESYDASLVKANMREAPSFWQLASRAGKRVIVYNVPLTYPPERVNGLMVSGLLTPDGATDASYPRELHQRLQQAIPGLVLSGHGLFQKGHEDEFVRGLLKIHDQNMRAAEYLMGRQDWDLFVMVFQHTDTVAHMTWKHMESKGAGLPESVREVAANAIQDIYRDVDGKLGQLIETAGEDTHVIIMSDHGHGRLEYFFSVNTWLLQKGYIKLKQDYVTRLRYSLFRLGLNPAILLWLAFKLGLSNLLRRANDARAIRAKQQVWRMFLSFQDVDWSRTRAFCYGPYGPIFVNLKGRYPDGSVEPGNDYDTVLDELTADLIALEEPGTHSPFVAHVYRGREIHSGPFADRGPDLFFTPRNWKYSSVGQMDFKTNRLFSSSGDKTGHHRMDGILFLSGPGIRAGCEISTASILDIAPTALALLGVPVPEDMDGRVLDETLMPELQEQLNVVYANADGLKPELQPVAEMSVEDEELLIARLRNLGYVA